MTKLHLPSVLKILYWYLMQAKHIHNLIPLKKLKGGELILAGDVIKPKSNRLVIFDPGLHHSVESFKGTRKVLLLNPWTYKPEAFKNEIV